MRFVNDPAEELRVLQARAYGRDAAALSAAEIARLTLLEAREPRLDPDVPPAVDVDRGGEDLYSEAGAPESGLREPVPMQDGPERSVDPGAESESDEAAAATRRWPVWLIATAALFAVVAGVGMGWVFFGTKVTDAIALTPEEQQVREQLYQDFDDYDEGSIRAAGRADGVLAWTATRGDGEDYCLIIQHEDRQNGSCLPVEQLRNSEALYTQLQGFAEEDGEQWDSISAQLSLAIDGEPAVTVQRWTNTSADAVQQLPEEYRDLGQQLVDAGYQGWLQPVALDGEATIWRVGRADGDGVGECLIYAPERGIDEAPAVCGPDMMITNGDDGVEQRRPLTLLIVQPGGAVREIAMETIGWNPYVVIRDVPRTETGDVPEQSFDDLIAEVGEGAELESE